MKPVLCLSLCLFAQVPAVAAASSAESDLCQLAAERAAAATGVPQTLLLAITHVETQRGGSPWPWTVNIDGQGDWFDDRSSAVAAAQTALDAGLAPDIGCFQINTKWHGDSFPSVAEMFDPDANASHAAHFLTQLFDRYGNWSDAVAAYHSRDPEKGGAYLARVAAALRDGSGDHVDPPSFRKNEFPLLLAGEPVTPGSLVPRLSGRSPLIGGP